MTSMLTIVSAGVICSVRSGAGKIPCRPGAETHPAAAQRYGTEIGVGGCGGQRSERAGTNHTYAETQNPLKQVLHTLRTSFRGLLG